MSLVFSRHITSTSKDKGTHYLYMVKGLAQKKRLNQQGKKNNQKKVINMRIISREFITL
jgi:hypothetical protein